MTQLLLGRIVLRHINLFLITLLIIFVSGNFMIANMHGSPWRYDTHVPIIFAGPGIDAHTVSRLVHPVDVAPTIAAFLGMTPPGAAQGQPLKEVLP